MFTVESAPMADIVLKKLYMPIGIDEPERTRFMRAFLVFRCLYDDTAGFWRLQGPGRVSKVGGSRRDLELKYQLTTQLRGECFSTV